jgi:hypothetical protein
MNPPPDALLFISPGCPHCPAVLQGLSELLKESLVGKMTVVNVAAHPELAEKQGVRSAPWLRLGPFTFIGAVTDLRLWAGRANAPDGAARYVEYLLTQGGGYRQAAAFIAEDTQRLKPLLAILANPDASIDIRLGVSALLESHAGHLHELLPQLTEFTRHADHRVRADACHLLGLTASRDALGPVELCRSDVHEEVREIAEEAWEALQKMF